MFHRFFDNVARIGFVAQIANANLRLATGRTDHLNGFVSGILVSINHQHACAFAGEKNSAGASHPRTRRCDDADLVG